MTISEFFKEKYSARKDKDNIYGVGMSDTEFRHFIIQYLLQALEKQIQKKPIPIDYGKYIDVIDNARFLRGAYWCPNCKHVVKTGSFCSDCGQKLDWSDENERS